MKLFYPDYLLLLLFVMIAAYLRVDGVWEYYPSEDEAFHLAMAQGKDLREVLHFSLYETHPPLGSILLHYWLRISDNTLFVRSLSLIFGLLLIPLYYQIGKETKDRLAGLCCALVVTFSYGLIIQSFIIRYYAMFVFLVSLAFYYYLLWRKDRCTKYLSGYFICAVLAAFTHFTAILTFFVITLCELTEKKRSTDRSWLMVNAVIAVVAVTLYAFWYQTHHLANVYFQGNTHGLKTFLIGLFIYPLKVMFYIFTPELCFLVVIILWTGGVLLPEFGYKNRKLWFCLKLSFIALLVFDGLWGSMSYAYVRGRHSFWLIPFVITTAGAILSSFSSLIASETLKPLLVTGILILVGFSDYDKNRQARLSDFNEYEMTRTEHGKLVNYLGTLGRNAVIISDRDDAVRLVNIYAYLKEYAFNGKKLVVSAPYLQTHVLFNPFLRHTASIHDLHIMVAEAEESGLLAHVDTLVFTISASVEKLMDCKELDKKMVDLSRQGDKEALPLPPFNGVLTLVIIPKDDFMQKVINHNEKSGGCQQ